MELALVAHDSKKAALLEWASRNRERLDGHTIFATATTGGLLETELGLTISKTLSGPMGGDQQIGAKIAEGVIDAVIFFWDPMETQPHDTDVKALLRLAVAWDVPMACSESTAQMVIESSRLVDKDYAQTRPTHPRRRTA